MKLFLLLTLFSLSTFAGECKKHPIQVAVIDTGFGYVNDEARYFPKLCRTGHKDFSRDQDYHISGLYDVKVPVDYHGHGTNIVGIIDGYASESKVDYCIIVLKYYSPEQTNKRNAEASLEAIKEATRLHVDIINYSGGGETQSAEEKQAIKKFLNQGGKIVAAAGNNGVKLGGFMGGEFYPAMSDPRVIIVGNWSRPGVISKTSNYGKLVKRWEIGEKVTAYGITMTGTSQATAVATGKIIAHSANQCDLGF